MKHFIYFEVEDGGINKFDVFDQTDLEHLYGWMKPQYGSNIDDTLLLNWMESAEIGEYFDHRLGYLVRMKDKNK